MQNPRDAADYVRVHIAHRLTEFLHSTLELEAHFTILENSLREAGFETIQRGSIPSSRQGVITNYKLGSDFNKVLEIIEREEVTTANLRQVKSGIFVNCSPMAFHEPRSPSILDARIQYLSAR